MHNGKSIWSKGCHLLVVVLLFCFSSSCFADDEQFFNSNDTAIPPSTLVTSLPTPEEMEQNSIWDDIRQHLKLQDQYQRPEVYRWIEWLRSHPKILAQIFHNSRPYLYYVFQQTQRYQLPAEFALLPMIESAYNPFAFSSTGAVGIWQMMPGTAMIYGLDINWWYDGRRDIVTSTDRALTFLVSLREDLGDWLLAAAAYDAGAETIQKAIAAKPNAYQGSSFWRLSLSKETEDYVPKLLAISAIIADPHKYGIELPYIPDRPYFAQTQINSQLDISEISHLSRVSLLEIKQLNPGMRRWATSPDQQYTVLLPVENADIFRSNLARVAEQTHVTWQYHEVHSGQTLFSIAKNYHTSAELLSRVNHLSSDHVTPGQGLVVPLYLNRKYQLAQEQPGEGEQQEQASSSTNGAPISSEDIEKITAADILSGRLSSAESNTTAANDSQNSANNNSNNNDNSNNGSSFTDIANQIIAQQQQKQNNNQPIDQDTDQQAMTTKPIEDKDDLHTILNKLYSAPRS